MNATGRDIGVVLTFGIVVLVSDGCGQVSLGSTVAYCGVSGGVGQVDCGDVNRDHRIDVNDALLVGQYVAGMPVTVWLHACDVNCDGQITNADATMIDSYAAHLRSDFPCDPKEL